MQSHVRLQITGARETLAASTTLVRLLAGMNQVVLLQVRELSERLRADAAVERSLTSVRAKMNLQIAQLAEVLVAVVAFILNSTIPLLQRVR